ncbi:uncharacterized protein LOC142555554 isoform X2 [Primulina tabacum]|uniref:uncharacterized protein LOC142555554 isoform X2 n=1 Tax=Primulina tabacum TaxID=48773 RepID=UPI003F5A26D4
MSCYPPQQKKAATYGSDSSKKAEELQRKARAEKFGVVQPVSADEEGNKKAWLARFGSISKPVSADEDKKKARAIRFCKQSSSLSKEKGGKDTEEQYKTRTSMWSRFEKQREDWSHLLRQLFASRYRLSVENFSDLAAKGTLCIVYAGLESFEQMISGPLEQC